MRFILAASFFFLYCSTYSQTLFWNDTFEDSGAPSSGSRTPSTNFSCGGPPATSYFFRTNTAGINLISGTYSGMEGSKFWAFEDVDASPICVNGSASANQQVTWSGINITGRTNLVFRGLFAANGSFASNWEGASFGANQDYMAVEYRIDGGSWTKAIAFYAGTTGQTQTLKLETTGDLVGDGADLTYAFTEFSANIPGTGSLLDLRLNVFANGSGTEEMAADNFRLLGNLPTLPVTLGGFYAKAEGGLNRLNWICTDEFNNSHFEVERSTDGIRFEKIGVVNSKGNSNSPQEYSYVDAQGLLPVSAYYRLKQVDVNGYFSYSAVVLVQRTGQDNSVAYPNPFVNRLFVETKSNNGNRAEGIQVMDVAGRLYAVPVTYLHNGFVLATEKLPSAVYFVQWHTTGKVSRTVVIKK
ncbi:putative secreted protein (Por secretion system target) [Lacibacter cauensis]|uniref:Putative secreted protein (Por secretion system target) n=1 Tax=Lacibacter cauensis TaxID=510947 RepID=A0A562SKT2_9BACT|nr:T9SS type A sorting domain-containing protein [Lacibacter cauensis]TWI81693.1 putative secreted protein (Por secretion system target) [Lacibacter cauensis]